MPWLTRRLPAALLLLSCLSSCSLFRRRPAPAPTATTAPTPDPAAAPTPPTAARDLAGAMAQVLKLSPDQTTRVRTLLAATVQEANAARQQYPAGSPELAAALTRINQRSDQQLRQVLGPTTYRALQARQAEVQALMRQP